MIQPYSMQGLPRLVGNHLFRGSPREVSGRGPELQNQDEDEDDEDEEDEENEEGEEDEEDEDDDDDEEEWRVLNSDGRDIR